MSVVPADAAPKVRDEKRLRSLGITRPQIVGDAGTPAEVDGTSGLWRVDPEATAEDFEGRTALLSPFDRLIHDRVRAKELFDFESTSTNATTSAPSPRTVTTASGVSRAGWLDQRPVRVQFAPSARASRSPGRAGRWS